MSTARMFNLALYAAGLLLFVYLVRSSGLTWSMVTEVGWAAPALLVVIYTLVALLDALAWYVVARPAYAPSVGGLLVLRTGGESLTNGLPGGVVFGEAYKAVMLKRWYGTPYAASAPSLMALKFALGYSQAAFIVGGLALCYGLLRERSVELTGVPGLHWISLAVIVAMCLFMAVPLLLHARGRSFAGLARSLARLRWAALRGWLEARAPAFEQLDRGVGEVLGRERGRLLAAFGLSLLRWLMSVSEAYIILWAIGLEPSLATAFAIEAVGSAFRLVFFLVPSGIGGVHASIFALFKLYGLSSPAAGLFIVLKRLRELAWIGVGLALVAVTRGVKAPVPTTLSSGVSAPISPHGEPTHV